MQAAPSPGATAAGAGAETVRRDPPPVYERLATPETREEYFHGELRLKMPANPPHATQHSRLAYVLEAHVAEGYLSAVELLTRTGHTTDFAPDASVFPPPDPATGKRHIEELAFEVCSEQDLSVPTEKARDLIRRGVRRVFCIVVGGPDHPRRPQLSGSYVAEWSRSTNGWSPLPPDSTIQDPCLDPPMPVRALVDATASDDAVAEALRCRGNRIFQEVRAEGKAEGKAEGLMTILEVRGLALSEEARQRIVDCRDLALLESWTRRALMIDAADDLWETPGS